MSGALLGLGKVLAICELSLRKSHAYLAGPFANPLLRRNVSGSRRWSTSEKAGELAGLKGDDSCIETRTPPPRIESPYPRRT